MRWIRTLVALLLALGCAEPRQVPDRPAPSPPTASEPPVEKESRSSAWRLLPYREQVKRAVMAAWEPRAAIAKYPGRTTFGTPSRRTRLDVTIDSSGWLKSVSVKESSGLKYLDQSAVEAFEKTQPFPPPPPGPFPGNGDYSFTVDFNLE